MVSILSDSMWQDMERQGENLRENIVSISAQKKGSAEYG
jgi:hypothetical protein